FKKLVAIRSAILIIILEPCAVGDAAEVSDFPRICHAVAIRIELQQRIAAGDRTERVADHDAVSAKIGQTEVGQEESIGCGAGNVVVVELPLKIQRCAASCYNNEAN